MRILQPAEWSKPRGFSHGVAVDGPGRWIVLAGQTGGAAQPEVYFEIRYAPTPRDKAKPVDPALLLSNP